MVRAGVDLAAGGDENVISIWNEAVQLACIPFRFDDTTLTASHCVTIFKQYKLVDENIFLDDGGVGKAIIDQIRTQGYPNLRRVLNQSRAINTIQYANRGAELYFKFSFFLDYLYFLPDNVLKNQLSSRYYSQQRGTGKLLLESKREAKAKGHHSPDRADATVLAFAGVPIGYFSEETKPAEKTSSGNITQSEIVEMMDKVKFSGFEKSEGNRKLINGSVSVLLSEYYDEPDVIEEINRQLKLKQIV